MALSADDIAKIDEFLDDSQNLQASEIEAKYSVNRRFCTRLRSDLRKLGVGIKRRRRIDIEVLRKLKEADVDDADIAAHFNVSRQAVHDATKCLMLRKKKPSVADVLGNSASV